MNKRYDQSPLFVNTFFAKKSPCIFGEAGAVFAMEGKAITHRQEKFI